MLQIPTSPSNLTSFEGKLDLSSKEAFKGQLGGAGKKAKSICLHTP